MVFRILFLGVCMAAAVVSCPAHDSSSLLEEQKRLEEHSPSSLFVTKEGHLSSHVVRLLTLDGLYDEKDSLTVVVDKTQKLWVTLHQGAGNKERTDVLDTPERAAIREEVDGCVAEMTLYAERRPLLTKYTHAICHGAFVSGVRQNLSLLIVAWKQGVRFGSLVFLSGERLLRKEAGREDCIKNLQDGSSYPFFKKGWTMPADAPYETEFDMVKLVWDQTELPEDMAEALKGKITFVNAPRGENVRPGTKDTIREWIEKYHPEPGTVLAYSYPLLWSYQQLAGETALKGTGLVLDTAAPAASKKMFEDTKDGRVSLVFDTVGKCLYEKIHMAQQPAR